MKKIGKNSVYLAQTPHGSHRLWIGLGCFPLEPDATTAQTALDALSIWGGTDHRDNEVYAWEIAKNVPVNVIKYFMSRLHIDLTNFSSDYVNL